MDGMMEGWMDGYQLTISIYLPWCHQSCRSVEKWLNLAGTRCYSSCPQTCNSVQLRFHRARKTNKLLRWGKKNAAMRIHNWRSQSRGIINGWSWKQNSATTVLLNKTNNLLNLWNRRPDFCTCCTLTQGEIKRSPSSHPHRCFLGAMAHGA